MFHPTKNTLSETVRQNVVTILNQQLVNLLDLQLQTKQAHWNVRGPHFIGLHELFDKINDEVREFVDEVAERVSALGGVALGTVQEVNSKTKLKAYDINAVSCRQHIELLSTALATTSDGTRKSVDALDEAGDKISSDLMTGITAGLDQKLWFVEAHLHAKD
jgi:starvation-inducible DNA-binding protein